MWWWGIQGALQDPAGKRQCSGDQACSKNKLCYFHVLVSQTDVVSNTIRRKSFPLGLQHHPRDTFASAIFADWKFIWGADLLFFPPTLCPSSLVTAKTGSAHVYPTQSTRSHPGKTTWKAALQQHLLAVALSVLRPHCSGPVCVESKHQELLFYFMGTQGSCCKRGLLCGA